LTHGRLRIAAAQTDGCLHFAGRKSLIGAVLSLGGVFLMSRRMTTAIAALAITTSGALAQEVRVGIVLSYTGVGAELRSGA